MSSCSTRWRSPSSSIATAWSRPTCRWVHWMPHTSPCSMCVPSCTGSPAVAATCCWLNMPTTSARRCISVIGSTWPGCCPVLAAPSPTTPKAGCGPPAMPCPGAASQPCGGAPSGARWTRAWSNVLTKSCWPAMPNPNKMPVWCCGWPPRRPTPGCRSVPPRCAGWPTALRNCRRRGPERSSTTCWWCCWPVLPRW